MYKASAEHDSQHCAVHHAVLHNALAGIAAKRFPAAGSSTSCTAAAPHPSGLTRSTPSIVISPALEEHMMFSINCCRI
jgi:hypothetical protein